MQVWMIALGKTALIASGNPFRPSTTAMRISSAPRVLSSFITRSQNLAPSVVSIQMPRISFVPSAGRRARDRPPCCGRGPRRGSSPAWHRRRSAGSSSRAAGSATPSPSPAPRRSPPRSGRARRRAHRSLSDAPGFPHAHAAGVHRDDFLVEAGKSALVLGNQLRIKRAFAIARNPKFQLRRLAQNRPLRIAVAPIDLPDRRFTRKTSYRPPPAGGASSARSTAPLPPGPFLGTIGTTVAPGRSVPLISSLGRSPGSCASPCCL